MQFRKLFILFLLIACSFAGKNIHADQAFPLNGAAYTVEGSPHLSGFDSGKTRLAVYHNVGKIGDTKKAAIVCDMDRPGTLSVAIYDARTNRIITLADREYEAGSHLFYWDGRNANGDLVGSGVYFIFMTVNGMRDYKKLVVAK